MVKITYSNTQPFFLGGAEIDFDAANFLTPIRYTTHRDMAKCWPCGQGEQLCAAGVHLEVAAHACSERKLATKMSVRTPLTGADEHVKLAVELVEETTDNYEKTSGDVGGEVELRALRLGLLQDGDVGVGALGKEILVISQRPQ
jgi:hypothetical protein